jgi:hypothetical protein
MAQIQNSWYHTDSLMCWCYCCWDLCFHDWHLEALAVETCVKENIYYTEFGHDLYQVFSTFSLPGITYALSYQQMDHKIINADNLSNHHRNWLTSYETYAYLNNCSICTIIWPLWMVPVMSELSGVNDLWPQHHSTMPISARYSVIFPTYRNRGFEIWMFLYRFNSTTRVVWQWHLNHWMKKTVNLTF